MRIFRALHAENPHAVLLLVGTGRELGKIKRLSAALPRGSVRFLGERDGYRYEIVSNVLEEISPPAPIIKQGEKEQILRSPKNGVKSEAYLERYFGDKIVMRKRLREDVYRPIQGIIVKKIENTVE